MRYTYILTDMLGNDSMSGGPLDTVAELIGDVTTRLLSELTPVPIEPDDEPDLLPNRVGVSLTMIADPAISVVGRFQVITTEQSWLTYGNEYRLRVFKV